jgi:hypothetical protein
MHRTNFVKRKKHGQNFSRSISGGNSSRLRLKMYVLFNQLFVNIIVLKGKLQIKRFLVTKSERGKIM